MRDHGGGVRILMLVMGVLIILASILPQGDNAVVFGRYSETERCFRETRVSDDIEIVFSC